MKIAVNTRLLIPNKLDGIGWFTYETLKRIVQQRSNDEFIFIFDRNWDESYIFSKNVTPLKINPPSRHPFLWYLWFEHSLPKVLNKIKPDLFLSPDGYLSLNSKVSSLPVIHDLNFEHYPKDLPFWYRNYYRYYFPKYAKKATRIATVSSFSKKDIIEKYGVDEDKIDVIYNGIGSSFKPLSSSEKIIAQKKFTGGSPYFVFVGTLHPRKNIARLFLAYDALKNTGQYQHKLVIVGRKKWWTSEMENALENMRFKNDVIFYDSLDQVQLAKVLGGAEALIYPSTFEGFGIPLLESMQCGVPVLTSNITSMPEVAENAALLFNPFKTESISEAMKKIIHEPNLAEKLIENGNERVKEFSWDKTAGLLWESILKSIN